jgi:hypothetical protein
MKGQLRKGPFESDDAVASDWPDRLTKPSRSPVGPTWITGCEPVPASVLEVVLLPVEKKHVIAEQDERVRARTGADYVTMIVDILRGYQRRHVAAMQGAVVGKRQLGAAIVVAKDLPTLMRLYPTDRGDPDPAVMGVGASHHSLRPMEKDQPGTPIGLDQPLLRQ